jgi:hypothetical protein
MLTAIISVTALVIAVITYAMCKAAGDADRILDDERVKWARKWNEQREKENAWCDGTCKTCGEKQFCKFSEVK